MDKKLKKANFKLRYQSSDQHKDPQCNQKTIQTLFNQLSPSSTKHRISNKKPIQLILHGFNQEMSNVRLNQLNININNKEQKSCQKTVLEQQCKEKQLNKTLNKLKSKKYLLRSNRERKSQQFQRNIKRMKIQKLCENMKSKLLRNNTYRQPLRQQNLYKFEPKLTLNRYQIPQYLEIYIDCFAIIALLIFIIISSIFISFQDNQLRRIQKVYYTVFSIYFSLQIILSFVFQTKKLNQQQKIKSYCQIFWKRQIFIDLVVIIFLIIKIIFQLQNFAGILAFISLPTKIPELIERVNHLQRRLVTHMAYQKYASIAKIILFNFAFAHFVAVILSLVANLNPSTNWQTAKGISTLPWTQRYVWSYYWATTIMLTIGFGDLVPTNTTEAGCVIFVEFVSCLAFSYNISCLGSLLTALHERSDHVDHNRKIFNFIAAKNNFSPTLMRKVQRFIEDEAELKQKFCIDEENAFIASLPPGCSHQLTCQSNISTLKCLPFFSDLLNKSIYKLSERMIKHIYTPQEVIYSPCSPISINILQSGAIGYYSNQKYCKYRGIPINLVTKKHSQKPFLTSLNIITMKQITYSIKSLVYSIIHKLNLDDFVSILKEIPKDYEYYCFLRDQAKYKIDQYETVDCPQCSAKHTYFDCPKYHFIPLKTQVIEKSLRKNINGKSIRIDQYQRKRRDSFIPLKARMVQQQKTFQLSKTYMRSKRYSKASFQQVYSDLIKNLCFKQNESDHHPAGQFSIINAMQNLIKLTKSQMGNYYEDEVWQLELDKAHHYDIYFSLQNADNLDGEMKKVKLIS